MTEEEALYRTAALCSTGEHCPFEIKQKLVQYELPTEVQERILQRLQKDNYLNEQRYAAAFANDKFRFNKWGKVKISQALRMKRIDDSLIAEALEALDETAYTETLKGLLATKKKQARAKTPYELKMKLLRFAVGRGFEPSVVSKLLSMDHGDELD